MRNGVNERRAEKVLGRFFDEGSEVVEHGGVGREGFGESDADSFEVGEEEAVGRFVVAFGESEDL
jgi:hypothetical protein